MRWPCRPVAPQPQRLSLPFPLPSAHGPALLCAQQMTASQMLGLAPPVLGAPQPQLGAPPQQLGAPPQQLPKQ